MILVFILFFFIVAEILQFSGGHGDTNRRNGLTYAASGWIFREWNENKISRQYILL